MIVHGCPHEECDNCNLNNSEQRNQNAELPFSRLMMEDNHPKKTADAAEYRDQNQCPLRYPPLMMYRPALVDAVHNEGDNIYNNQNYIHEYTPPGSVMISVSLIAISHPEPSAVISGHPSHPTVHTTSAQYSQERNNARNRIRVKLQAQA